MKNFEIAFRSLFKRGRSNVIKILALTIGLTMGLILIAKVCYESSFESFYPDYERIYLVHETLIRDGELMSYGQISGGVIPKLEAEIPEIEEATRITYAGHLGSVFKTSDQKSYSANGYLVDTTFFDVLPRNILIGNPKEILANPEDVMISEKLALTLGGIDQALGQDIIFDAYPDRKFHIAGVFEDVPENTVLKYDILFSIYMQAEWSLSNWLGNDCYQGLVKLNPQTDYKMLDPALREVQTRHADMQLMADAGVDLRYTLEPFIGQHSQNEEVRSMNRLLLILAVILIFATVMNYILIVISTLINRTKEVAVYKCYGASTRNLLGLTFTESLIHIVLALIFGLFIILLFRSRIESLLDASLGALFTLQTMSVLAWICVLVFLITAFIPAYLYLHVPVAAAFRNYKESRRYWKLALLFVQFVATAYFVSMLFIVNRQYHHLINTDLGYSYDKLYYTNLKNIDPSVRNAIENELKKLPQVKRVSSAFTLPCEHASGNNIYLPGRNEEFFNIADLYFTGDDYFELMEIPVIQGETFATDGSSADKVMVSRSFIHKINQYTDWGDQIVGKSILITEHSQYNQQVFTICGVYDDINIGNAARADNRPSVIFHKLDGANHGFDDTPLLLVKMNDDAPEALLAVTEVIDRMIPTRQTELVSYANILFDQYYESRNFRESVLIGGLITLIIALIGLLGYTADEINRRRREIAIRKINGASAVSILKLISRDISYIALPGLVAGCLLAYFSGKDWMIQFAEKAAIPLLLLIGTGMLIYCVIVSCTLYRTWHVANSNPVDHLKSE